ncbi:50S ribosomal protein L15 [Salinifilum aidingensis]
MVIKIHDLKPAPGAKRKPLRVGRGEGSKGKTAGRGTKGTTARKTVPPMFEGGQMPIQMRLPKLRGFRNPSRIEYKGVNVGRIAEVFPQGGQVGLADLVDAGLVKKNELVKVLGDGDVDGVKLDVSAHAFTGSAQEKITNAGGSANKVKITRKPNK